MNNDSNNEQEKIEAGRNTAHNLGKAAATRVGGRVGGAVYDKVAQTKLGQNLENRLGNKIAKTPIVGSANKALNKVGNSALNKNKANRKNYLSFLNRKKQNNTGDSEGGNPEESQTTGESATEEMGNIVQKVKKIILIAKIAAPIVCVLFIILTVAAIISSIADMFGVVNGGLGDGTPATITENKNEQKYYEKLDKLVSSYQKSCGITIDKSYIHSVLIYPTQNYEELFEQEFDLEDIKNESEEVDYKTLTEKIDTVAKLLVSNCTVEYEIGGTAYNNIKNSNFFKDYYKELLKKAKPDVILEDVFNLAELGSTLFSTNWFINDKLTVKLGNCKYENGAYVDKEQIHSVGFSDYIKGVMYGEMGAKYITTENKEFLKAFTIVASSYVLSRSKYQSGDTELWARNGNCWQLSADVNKGSTYVETGDYDTMYPGDVTENKKDYFPPLSQEKMNILNEVFKEVFGTLMISGDGQIKNTQYRHNNAICEGDGECMGQMEAVQDAQSGMTYEEILNKYYKNFTLTNAQEDLYADKVTYNDGGYKNNVVFYKQTDYNDKFCGRTDGATISSSGCGVTAMAIVLSTFVNDTFTPPVVMNEAYGMGSCGTGISGTSTSFFKKSADLHNLEYKSVSKKGDLQSVLDALESGKSLVIAHMGQGTFTSGGHYIVLSRVNDKGQVYVYDPYHDVNVTRRKSGNGWYDFNSIIVKQLGGKFHIITKG